MRRHHFAVTRFLTGLSATRWLRVILFVSVLLRVAAALYMGDRVTPLPGTYDQVTYDALAQSLLAGRGFSFAKEWWPATPANTPTAHWSFLYPLYLAAVYGLFGHHPLIARLIQAVASGILLPLLAFRVGRHVLGPKVGLIAAGLSAIYIYLVYYNAALVTETFHTIAILWSLDIALELSQRPTNRRWLEFGLALGIAALLRQVILVFVPVLFIWLLWAGHKHVRLRDLLIPTIVMVALIVPWTLRNYLVFHRFVLLNTNAGFAFFWANHPRHGTDFIPLFSNEEYAALIPQELRGLNEAEMSDALMQRGLGFVVEDPWRYFLLSLSRVKELFKFWPSAGSSLISNLARVLSFGLALPFILHGLFLSRSRWRQCLLLYLFIAAYSLVYLLSWVQIRYRIPMDPVLLVFAGLSLSDLANRFAPWFSRLLPLFSQPSASAHCPTATKDI